MDIDGTSMSEFLLYTYRQTDNHHVWCLCECVCVCAYMYLHMYFPDSVLWEGLEAKKPQEQLAYLVPRPQFLNTISH